MFPKVKWMADKHESQGWRKGWVPHAAWLGAWMVGELEVYRGMGFLRVEMWLWR